MQKLLANLPQSSEFGILTKTIEGVSFYSIQKRNFSRLRRKSDGYGKQPIDGWLILGKIISELRRVVKIGIDSSEFGFRWNDIVALYWKRGKWRIYEKSAYTFSTKKRDSLINEVASEKRVKKSDVMIGTVEKLIVDVDIICMSKKRS